MFDLTSYNIDTVRSQFPYFTSSSSSICFDGVGGTQVPQRVISAISEHLIHNNGNKGGIFKRSRETDAVMDATRQSCADLVNADDPLEIVLGSNFTSLTFAFSRALARILEHEN